MLKWAVTPRLNGEIFEHNGIQTGDGCELLTLQAIVEQHRLPCLVRLVSDDINESIDNYCLLLCQINEPYLLVSNESERFSVPTSFDGLFAPVERGITRYNILQTVRALQSHLKSQSSSEFSHFTTLQPCTAYSNSALRRIRPGTILEPCRTPLITSPSPSPSNSSSSSSAHRLRALLANLPHSLNKHLLPHQQQSRIYKNQMPPNDCLEVKSIQHDEHFCLKSDSVGAFIPVHTQLASNNPHRRTSLLPTSSPFSSSSSSSNQIQGLYTVELLSKLTHQYPLITELVVSRTFEESVPTSVGYPFRRLTLHRLIEKHSRIIAFDMKNYTFLELDTTNPADLYAVEHEDTLFQRYQAQLRWCDSHVASFRPQIKTIVHSSHGTTMFVQTTPLQGQQPQQYHQRRDSTSTVASPLAKHIPQTIFTSQESISSIRSRIHTPSSSSKFNTASNQSKQEPNLKKGLTTGAGGAGRKDVRVYFNDPAIQKRLQTTSNTRPTIKQFSFNKKSSTYRMNSTGSDSVNGDEVIEDTYQCTAL